MAGPGARPGVRSCPIRECRADRGRGLVLFLCPSRYFSGSGRGWDGWAKHGSAISTVRQAHGRPGKAVGAAGTAASASGSGYAAGKKREPPEHTREYALDLGGRTIALRRTSSTIFHRTEKIAVQLGLSAMVDPCFSNVHVNRKILFDLLDRSGVKRMGPSRGFSMITSMEERRSPRWSRALT